MIDIKTGYITLNDAIVLTPESTIDSITENSLDAHTEIRDMGNGYKWLDIYNLQINREYYILSLCFEKNVLTMLTITVNGEPFNLNSDYDSWDQRDEKRVFKYHERWLKKRFGRKREFLWGNVWAEYDPRSASSSMGLRYK